MSDQRPGTREAPATRGVHPGEHPRRERAADGPVAIGIDVGGTRLRAAIIRGDGALTGEVRRPTPAASRDELLDGLVQVIEGMPVELPVGVGIAGLVDLDGTVRYGPNIGIRDLPLGRLLAERLERPVTVLNDASAATFAEQRVGVARGHLDVVLLTIGTGVGGGFTIGGRLVVGASGYAGELGHLVVEEGGRPCPCGNHGCLEAYASGTAIAKIAAERRSADGRSSTSAGIDLDGAAVTAAAADGDPLAQSVLVTVGEWLGVALASLVNVLDPEVVVVGGGAAVATAPWVLPAARESMAVRIIGSTWRTPPPVELAVLGDDAGTVGAGLLAAGRAAGRAS